MSIHFQAALFRNYDLLLHSQYLRDYMRALSSKGVKYIILYKCFFSFLNAIIDIDACCMKGF